jgi:hypothetical protein
MEHPNGGFFSSFGELLIQGSSALAFAVESLRRLGFLVGGFFQLALKVGDVVLGNHHLLVKLVEVSINLTPARILMNQVEVFINLTRDRVLLMDQAEWVLI